MATGSEVKVETPVVTELPNRGDGVLGEVAEVDGRARSMSFAKALEVLPERVDQPGVTAAWPLAAPVRLEDHNSGLRVPAPQGQRGPEARIAPADDRDIGHNIPIERFGRLDLLHL